VNRHPQGAGQAGQPGFGDLDQQLADLGVGKAEPQAASTRGLASGDGKGVKIAHGEPRQTYALQWIVLHD
jgi:hypothetical protein